jgi:hypothetical protein
MPGKASTRGPAICHALRELRVCLATAEAASANLHEVLRFQHSPSRSEKDLAGEARAMPGSGDEEGILRVQFVQFPTGAASGDGGYAALGG